MYFTSYTFYFILIFQCVHIVSNTVPLYLSKLLHLCLSFSLSSLSLRYWDLSCSENGQEVPGGEFFSIYRTCHSELSSFLCPRFLFALFFYVKTESPHLLFCILVCRFRLLIYFSTFLSPTGNPGSLTWVRHSSRKSRATHSYQCVVFFFLCVCPNNDRWLPVFGIFDVPTDDDAYDCTREMHGHRKRVDLH